MRSGTLRVGGGARAVVLRRCGGACEACGLEWPWHLYVFLIDETQPARAGNLRVLCGGCSSGLTGGFAPLLTQLSYRDRMREANNMRTGAVKMTASRRRKLIAERGGCCEICGVPGDDRQLQVHHRRAVLRGGDDSEANLLVLCFACHHQVQPCANACGHWVKKPHRVCRHCLTEARLRELRSSAGAPRESLSTSAPRS